MPQQSLSHLYFESAGLSKTPLKWLLCAAFIHAGLCCIPTGGQKPNEYGIVFRQGNAGVEVDLITESVESTPEQAPVSQDSSPDPVAQPPEPDQVIAEVEENAPPKPKLAAVFHPPRSKSTYRTDRAMPALHRVGTATAQPATSVYTTQPPYPAQAREVGAEGVVRLQVRVGTDGSARDVKIVRPSGRSDFDLSSVKTVQRKWRFRPARSSDGEPVESTIVVDIRFTLKS
ncbi:MAG TPA: energy transducer TonB [Chthoniobacterales bacterium]|nr:energy transducer TonB [Chthoniobacterales bacterium]